MSIKDSLSAVKEKADAKLAEVKDKVEAEITDRREKISEERDAKNREKAFRDKIEKLFSSAIENLRYYSKERTGIVKEAADEVIADMSQRVKSVKKLDLEAFKIDCDNLPLIVSEERHRKSEHENAAQRKLEESELDKVYKISGKTYHEVIEIVNDFYSKSLN